MNLGDVDRLLAELDEVDRKSAKPRAISTSFRRNRPNLVLPARRDANGVSGLMTAQVATQTLSRIEQILFSFGRGRCVGCVRVSAWGGLYYRRSMQGSHVTVWTLIIGFSAKSRAGRTSHQSPSRERQFPAHAPNDPPLRTWAGGAAPPCGSWWSRPSRRAQEMRRMWPA